MNGPWGVSCAPSSLGIEYIIQSALEKQPEYKSGQLYLFGALFLNYHALFRMDPMDELSVPSDWPTTPKFDWCCLEKSEFFFPSKFDSLWFCTSLLQPQETYMTKGVAGGITPPHFGRQIGLQNEYFKWKQHDFPSSTNCIVFSRL